MLDLLSYRALKLYLSVIVGFTVFAGVLAPDLAAREAASPSMRQTLVIDPGHGGREGGCRGQSGVFEKAVTLSLARMISREAGHRYRIVLTRTDDYWLDIAGRTAVANHERADLFISLHAGGSASRQIHGMHIFRYKSLPGSDSKKDLDPAISPESDPGIRSWDDLQKPVLARSERLAAAIRLGIQNRLTGVDIDLREAPIRVLAGAEMPSILLEIGYLTNPVEEKALKDKYFLTDLAKGIIAGIDDYLQQAHKGSR